MDKKLFSDLQAFIDFSVLLQTRPLTKKKSPATTSKKKVLAFMKVKKWDR